MRLAKTILIADDSPNIVKLLEVTFSLKKYQTITAFNGNEALNKAGRFKPDLIILDVVMPKLNGFQVLQRLKEKPATKDIPVIMLTGVKEKKDLYSGFTTGAYDYVSKPFNPADLSRLADKILRSGEKKHPVSLAKTEGRVKLAFIGPKKGEDELLELFLSNPQVKVIGYLASSSSQAGRLEKLGVNLVQTEEELLNLQNLDLIIDSGGILRDEFIDRANKKRIQVVSARLKDFMLELLKEHQKDLRVRQDLTRELVEKQKIVEKLLSQVIDAQEEERKRISAEIHDSISQSLVGTLAKIQITQKLLQQDPAQALSQLSQIRDIISENIKETKRIIYNLRPPLLDDLGLVHSIENYARKFSKEHSINVKFKCNKKTYNLPKMHEILIFRIIQESLNNIHRHSKAGHARIDLYFKPMEVKLTVEDKGSGFNMDKIKLKINQGRSFGLAGIKERVSMLGGDFKINTYPEKGTCISITLPERGR